ncbi:MAG TPA: type VI secretion system contractile sheath large subunit [Stellaceae bacterium]|nr:type VI secretion system contractile sheath large subunit [Stellaceae bacterium]
MPDAEGTNAIRKLAAILAADVVGYSRLMGSDELGTVRALRDHRGAIDPVIARHGGRIVKTTGDGLLIEFPSIVGAIECGVAIQDAMATRNQGIAEERRMVFRIGINLGDVLVEGDDILGDGVNIAARLEGIAEPGGICVSGSAFEHVHGKIAAAFEDIGEQSLKNIARPIRVYRVKPPPSAEETPPAVAAPAVEAAAPLGPQAPLRDRIATAADQPPDVSVFVLDRFLAEDSASRALEQWLGGETYRVHLGTPHRLKALLDRDVAAIDAILTDQVNAILHAEPFQNLEAIWRGTHYLVAASDGVAGAKVRILPASWSDLVRDLERAADFDRSELFEKIYSQEFGMPGGEPFGLLIGDYFLSHRRSPHHPTDDVAALKALAAVAAAAFAPFVAGCDPSILGFESFRDLTGEVTLDAVFQQAEYVRWQSLRQVEDSRFVGLCLPKILMRRPWWDDPSRAAPFRFREDREHAADNGYLWGNAAFAFAAIAIRAFGQSGWFAELRGARRGEITAGLLDDLPLDSFTTDRPAIAFKRAADVAIPDRQERVLSDLGFIPLSTAEHTPHTVFYSNQSLNQPQHYSTSAAATNARLSSMLQYVLCVGRFAHTIKVIGRDRIGSFTTPEECQTAMQKWLTEYVNANPNASLDQRVKYPLREGRVTVTELAGRPGVFKMDMYLRPHLQLDDISTGIRLTTELAAPRAA